MENVHNLDTQVDKVTESSLRNPNVVRRILEHFPDAELLKLSFVNKLWNFEARSVMRRRCQLVAHLFEDCGTKDPCKLMDAFGTDLQQMNVVPFSGISIELKDYPSLTCQTTVLDSVLEAIRDRVSLKHLSVKLYKTWWNHQECPQLLLIKRILHRFSQELVTLSLLVDLSEVDFVENFVQHCNFPRLEILKLYDCSHLEGPHPLYTNFVKSMVPRAPNLQELHTNGNRNQISRLLEGRSILLKTCTEVYPYSVSAPFDEIPDSVIGAVRPKHLDLVYTGPQFNFQRFNRITPSLLQACCSTTLRSMTVDGVLALPLACYGLCLENVTSLCMNINYNMLAQTERLVLEFLKNFDFFRIFPSLNSVSVYRSRWLMVPSRAHLNAIIEEADAVLGRRPVPYRAFNIKQLALENTFYRCTANFFAEMFPNIELLKVEKHDDVILFWAIWSKWKDLKEVRVSGKVNDNLDSVFCGIFPEEVAELRQKDDEYLKRVNIVPVMPAITCLRELRTFNFKLSGRQDRRRLFSKVTGLVAFARCPNLAVTLEGGINSNYEDLLCMAPYADVKHYVDVVEPVPYVRRRPLFTDHWYFYIDPGRWLQPEPDDEYDFGPCFNLTFHCNLL